MERYFEEYGAWFRVRDGVLEDCPALTDGSQDTYEGEPNWCVVEEHGYADALVAAKWMDAINDAFGTTFNIERYS